MIDEIISKSNSNKYCILTFCVGYLQDHFKHMHMHKFHNPTLQKDKWTDVTLTRKFSSPKFANFGVYWWSIKIKM